MVALWLHTNNKHPLGACHGVHQQQAAGGGAASREEPGGGQQTPSGQVASLPHALSHQVESITLLVQKREPRPQDTQLVSGNSGLRAHKAHPLPQGRRPFAA